MSTEPETENTTKGDNRLTERPRSSDFVALYVNNSVCGFSTFDIQIVFSRNRVTLSGAPSLEEIASVAMSPTHAKAFLQSFSANLKTFEDTYGEIVMPATIQSKPQE